MTTLYLRNVGVSDIQVVADNGSETINGGTVVLSTSRGSAANIGSRSTDVAQPRRIVGGVSYLGNCYVSPPLSADVTIYRTITANLRMWESSMSANIGARVRIERCDSLGNFLGIIVDEARGVEMGTSEAAQNWNPSVLSASCKKGDRIKVIVSYDAVGTEGTGYLGYLATDGPTAGASGDSYISFTDTLDFAALPAPTTKLYLTDDAGPDNSSGIDRLLKLAQSGSAQTATTNTVAGPTTGKQLQIASANYEWWSNPLDPVTITAGSLVSVNLPASVESAIAANVCWRVKVEKTAADGTSPVTIVDGTYPLELPTVGYAILFYLQVASDVSVASGEIIHVVVYGDDVTAIGNMASGYTFATNFGGTADTWIGFEQTIAELSSTPKSGTEAGTGADTSSYPVAQEPGVEAGTGTDTASTTAAITATPEASVGADGGSQVGVYASDAGVGTDGNAQVGLAKAATEAGVGADSASPPAYAPATTEAGVGADSAAGILLTGPVDAGAGTDTGAVSVPVTASAEAGVGADTSYPPAYTPATSDAGTGADSSTVGVTLASSDAGVGTDGSAVSAPVAASDAGVGADAASLAALASASDAGVGADAGAPPAYAPLVSDSGVGADPTPTVVQGGGDQSIGASDAGVGADAAALAAVLTVVEEDTVGEWSAGSQPNPDWSGDPTAVSRWVEDEGHQALGSWYMEADSLAGDTYVSARFDGTFHDVFGVSNAARIQWVFGYSVARKVTEASGPQPMAGEVEVWAGTPSSQNMAALSFGWLTAVTDWRVDYGTEPSDISNWLLTGTDTVSLRFYTEAHQVIDDSRAVVYLDELDVRLGVIAPPQGVDTASVGLATADAGVGVESASVAILVSDAGVGAEGAGLSVLPGVSSDAGVGVETARIGLRGGGDPAITGELEQPSDSGWSVQGTGTWDAHVDNAFGNPAPSRYAKATGPVAGVTTWRRGMWSDWFPDLPGDAAVLAVRLVRIDRNFPTIDAGGEGARVELFRVYETLLVTLANALTSPSDGWVSTDGGYGWQDVSWADQVGYDTCDIGITTAASSTGAVTEGWFDNLVLEARYQSINAGGIAVVTASLAAVLGTVADAGAGAESAGIVAAVGASDAGTGADSASVDQGFLPVAASDAGTGADAASALAVLIYDAAYEWGFGHDSALFAGWSPTVIDAGTGADPTPAIGLGAVEAGTGADVATPSVTLAGTAEVGVGADAATTGALVPATDAGTGTDAPGTLVAMLDVRTDAGVGADSGHAEPAQVFLAASDAGTGADSASVPTGVIDVDDGSSGAAQSGWIVVYDRAYAVDDIVSFRSIAVADQAHAWDVVLGGAVGYAPDPWYPTHPIYARALYADLINRYGPVEGRRVYEAMERERKGPFAPGAKYGEAPPPAYPPTYPAASPRAAVRPRYVPPPIEPAKRN